MILLAASLVALTIGPALMAALARTSLTLVALDAAVVVTITGLVMLHIVPESVAVAGWPALVALSVGLGLPAVLHGSHDACHPKRPPGIFLALAVGALGLHALLDGVALVPAHGAAGLHVDLLGTPLALGVVLHRLMEGAGVWWLTGNKTPTLMRLLAVGGVGLMTVLGYGAGSWAVGNGALATIASIQAMVAGSLMHVLMRHAPDVGAAQPAPGSPKGAWGAKRLASALGGLGGMVLLGALQLADGAQHHGHSHGAHAATQAVTYLHLLATGIGPAVLGALALAALMHMAVPKWHSASQNPRPSWAAAFGTLQGLLLAPCSCGVVPLYRRLLARRAPDAQALAYLLAAPGLGLVTLAISWAILGPTLTLLRVAGAIALSAGVALVAAPHEPWTAAGGKRGHVPGHRDTHKHSHGSLGHGTVAGRAMDGLAFSLGEVADFTGPWLLLGLMVAALCGEGLDPSWLQALEKTHLAVPVMALLALPLYLCGSASTLIAAVLLGKGLSPGGALAFMWSASMLSPAALGALRRRGGARLSTVVGALVCLGTVAAGFGVQWVAPAAQSVAPVLAATPAAQAAPAAWALWALLAWAIARQGVRPAVDQIALLNRDGAPSHHHGSH
jgi:uncharacterized membrane protein YraQ (UPF0718 family)